MSEPALTRVTVNLPADQVKKIKELAQAEGTNVTSIIRDALKIELFLYKTTQEGGKIIIDNKGGQKELLFRI